MKLLTARSGSSTRACVMVGDLAYDIQELLELQSPVRDIQALFELGQAAVQRLRDIVASPDQTGTVTGIAISDLQFAAPVIQPPTIRDFMVYEGHASMGGQWKLQEAFYRLPPFYFSNPLCLYAHNETVPYPSATRKFDFELEIAAVICREGRNVPAAEAENYIGGFAIFNDWSSRDLQRDEMQLNLGPAKGKDSATSVGPWVVTLDELSSHWKDGQLDAHCTLQVNGTQWVDGNAGGMLHDWAAMIERASRDSRIVPGDLICSGTIAGGSIPEAIRLGYPARYLLPGDHIEIEVEGLGKLATTIGQKQQLPDDYRFLPPRKS